MVLTKTKLKSLLVLCVILLMLLAGCASPPAPPANTPLPGDWHTNIVTTYFNPGTATWGNDLNNENPFYFALPYRDFYYYVWNPNTSKKELKKQDYYGISNVKNRWIEIIYPAKNIHAFAQWEDVGPWNYYDPYYVFSTNDTRPYAEIGIDMGWSSSGYRETNKAGLDLSPTAIKYLNNGTLIGKITANWRFVAENEVPVGPWKTKVSASGGDSQIFNLNTATLRTSQ
jgi:hypothetical protein